MQIGVPREIKNEEFRVALTPAAVGSLVDHGHQVYIETGAGEGAGYSDADFTHAGASILPNASALYEAAELIIKVKEPQREEITLIEARHTLFCYLHLAADPELTSLLQATGATMIAFETVEGKNGGLPLLAPMSDVAGRLAVQVGAAHLERERGGAGILLCPIQNVPAGKVVVLGAGHVGMNAIAYAAGIGARVVVLDRSEAALERVKKRYGERVETRVSTPIAIEENLADADLIVGAVLVPGASAPKLILREHLALIRDRRVIVDVAIDQGGCVESSRPTTHDDPVFVEQGVVHYCVTNMPGVVPRTSTKALSEAILPYAQLLAQHGVDGACEGDAGLAKGINVRAGEVVLEALKKGSAA